MKINSNIPKGIREGIFCLMTGTFVFLSNGVTADAADVSGQDEGGNSGVSNGHEIGENAQNAAETQQEASELISVPEQPGNSKTTETIDESTSVATKTTENTYVEVTDNAVATTDETVVETTVTNPETLTKDTENATTTTETTQTVNDDGTVTTTQTTTTTGEYVEDVTTVETNSVTNIVTSDEELANEIVNQVDEQSQYNTDQQGINVDQVTQDTYIDNAVPGQDPIALNDQQAAELANVSDGTVITVETTNGQSTVSINGEEANLSEGLTNIIVDSAKENVVQQSSTFYINGQEISGEELGSLELDSLGAKTDFSIVNNDGAITIIYVDANGNTRMVADSELKDKLLSVAQNIKTESVVEEYNGLIEYDNVNDPELIAERERLESIGYKNIRLVDGTGTYVNGTIEPETYKTQTEAENRANELNNDGKHANAKAEKSGETYVSGQIDKEYYESEADAKARADALNSDGKHQNATYGVSGETYVSGQLKEEHYKSEADAKARADALNSDGKHQNATYDKSGETYVSGQLKEEHYKSEADAKARADALNSDGKHKNATYDRSGETYVSGQIDKEYYKSEDGAKNRVSELNNDGKHKDADYEISEKTYKIENSIDKKGLKASDAQREADALDKNRYINIKIATDTVASKTEIDRVKAELRDKGFSENEITIKTSGEGDDITYTVVVQQTLHTKETTKLATLDALEKLGYSVTWETGDPTPYQGQEIFYNATAWSEAITALENDEYTISRNADSKKEAEEILADLKKKGFEESEVTLAEQSDGSYKVSVNATYNDQATATQRLAYLRDNGFTDQQAPKSTTTKEEGINLGTCTESEKELRRTELEKEYKNVNFTECGNTSSGQTIISAFDGFSVTTESEYNRIISLENYAEIDGVMQYWEDNEDGTRTYYKVKLGQNQDQTIERYTILAMTGNLKHDVSQHQEGAVFVGSEHGSENFYYTDDGKFTNVDYTVDFNAFKDKAKEALQEEKTSQNDRKWFIQDEQAYWKYHVTTIDDGGIYYIDATPDKFVTVDTWKYDGTVYVATDKKVTIVLYSDYDTVLVPVISNKTSFQQISTSNGGYEGDYLPNVTFVTAAKNVKIQNVTNVGNILALNATVSFVGQGQHCGTIVCQSIDNTNTPVEGHIYEYGYKGYLVDSQKVTNSEEKIYSITGDKETTTYSISGEKEVYTVSGSRENYKLTVSKDATLKALTADEVAKYFEVTANILSDEYQVTADVLSDEYKVTADVLSNKYEVTADELANKYVVTADKLAKKQRLVAERTVEVETQKASMEKTEYSKTATSLDRTFGIQISRYSRESVSDPWTETTVVELPPETPPTPPTPPVVPPTPPVTPDTPVTPPSTPTTPTTTTTTIIIDDATPLAGDVAQVLGARRAPGGPAVLGARRARTGDMAHDPLVSSLIMMGASAAALSLLLSLKKRREDQ